MRRVLLALAFAAIPCAVYAQVNPSYPPYVTDQNGTPRQVIPVFPVQGPPPSTTTAVALTGSATAGTFTTALAARPTRQDCTIYSASAFNVSPGPSPSAATALPVAAGGTFKCASFGATMTDQINVSSATVSAQYVVWSQP